MVSALLIAGAAAAAAPAAAAPAAPVPDLASALSEEHGRLADESCKGADGEITVCGRSVERYRLDRSLLEAERARNAPPPKPEVTADASVGNGCTGPKACQGSFVPLVAVALTAVKAATLAANGEDWREALRTKQDEYRLKQQAEERRRSERKVRIGFGAGN